MVNALVGSTLAVLLAVLGRWCISLNPYSGSGKPPMYGDYEAQRHWMEITYNLPIKEWYVNSTDNDLQYWGLDYPPLTAYHSWLCGKIGNYFNPKWVKLFSSRGFESASHKLFMRYTVLIADLLIYIPAVLCYCYFGTSLKTDKEKILTAIVILLYPGLMLIDYGHFQYNCISLGFAIWAVVLLVTDHNLLGSIAFCLALNYKQMELYHAMPFFCYLLGLCWKTKNENRLFKLLKIAVVTLVSFAVCWLPFLHDKEQIMQVVHRLFPFARGLYEDKVSNFWCSISVLVKLKDFPREHVLLICLVTTLLALVPSSLHLLLKPSSHRFKIALINSSLVFFLFSFQVHEKSILIPAISVCLLFPNQPFQCLWFLLISNFSMLPLLIKDGLTLPYLASAVLFYVMCVNLLDMQDMAGYLPLSNNSGTAKETWKTMLQAMLFWLSMFGCAVLTLGSIFLTPPKAYPDLFPVLIAIYSCGHFLLFLLYFSWYQVTYLEPSERPPEPKPKQHKVYGKKKRH